MAEKPYVDCIGHSEQQNYRYDYDLVTKAFAKNHKVVELNGNSVNVRRDGIPNMKLLLAACLKNGNDVMTDEADMVAAAARDALDRGLLTEADIDRAVGNSLSGRFRLGEFDGDSCPYNTAPAETATLLHRAVNRCAAMEQMCLLHNRGILPLQLLPDARIAKIGPLLYDNYRDWYTGVSSYAVPILE